jgi:Domain of unknown function (DUF6798)
VTSRAIRRAERDQRRALARTTACATTVIVLLALLLYGAPVPRLSEELYLPLVRHTGDSAYLAGDWTLRGPFGEHWVFDHLFGPVAAHVPLPWFGWIGRIVTAAILGALLLRLGRRYALGPWAAAIGVGLWLVANQSLICSDWMFGTFEAKTIAYCLLLAALLAATADRPMLSVVLLGATLSFHPGVGGWAALAGAGALVADPHTRGRALRAAPLGLLLAVPGVVAVSGTLGTTSDLAQFLVLKAIPHHADPFFGGAQYPTLQVIARTGALAAMYACNVYWYRRSGRDPALRFLLTFQTIALVPVVAAFVARTFDRWDLLLLQPLRLGPLIVPLCFYLGAVARVAELRATEPRNLYWYDRRSLRLAAATVVVAVFLTSPILAAPRMTERTVLAWTRSDDTVAAFEWLRAHTPPTTRCVVPVDRQDAYMIGERPIVANFQAIRYDELAEWRRRVDALVGGPEVFAGHVPTLGELGEAYAALDAAQMTEIARDYDADCIVTTAAYPFPVLHRAGDVRIYRNPASAAP